MNSIQGRIWQLHHATPRDILFYQQRFGFSEIAARLLATKQLPPEEVEQYLKPTLKALLPNPDILLDMQKAVEAITTAMQAQHKITIFGDYDVDGATSTSLLLNLFSDLGYNNVSYYIPDRIEEGYGPNVEAFEQLIASGTKLIITVDCGTISFEPILKAKKLGCQVVVIDHHLGDTRLPKASAIVNPNRLDQPHNICCNLAAVGVCFIVAVALIRHLRIGGYFENSNQSEPNLLTYLDLVALGTVCDVMTITGLNRAFVKQGLKVMADRKRIGINALCDTASLDRAPNMYHLGYVLGPRVNAGGRVGRATLGVELLISQNYEYAAKLAKEAELYNNERKALELLTLDAALLQAQAQHAKDAALIFVHGKGWHPGVIGIVAGRLKERFQKPTAVITFDEAGIGKASARSVHGIDFGSALVGAKSLDLIEAGGGHAMAAGFSMTEAKLSQLYEFLEQQFRTKLSECRNNINYYHGKLDVAAVNSSLAGEIELLGPYGNGNSEPRFVLSGVVLSNISFGKSEVAKFIAHPANERKASAKVTAFNTSASEIGDFLRTYNQEVVNLVGKISVNYWQGRKYIEFVLEDILT